MPPGKPIPPGGASGPPCPPGAGGGAENPRKPSSGEGPPGGAAGGGAGASLPGGRGITCCPNARRRNIVRTAKFGRALAGGASPPNERTGAPPAACTCSGASGGASGGGLSKTPLGPTGTCAPARSGSNTLFGPTAGARMPAGAGGVGLIRRGGSPGPGGDVFLIGAAGATESGRLPPVGATTPGAAEGSGAGAARPPPPRRPGCTVSIWGGSIDDGGSGADELPARGGGGAEDPPGSGSASA
jgi:hypothetical protein